MPIDWTAVGQSALLILPSAVASAYLGARIKAAVDRARPQVAVIACRVAEESDLFGVGLSLDVDLLDDLRDFEWASIKDQNISAASAEAEIALLSDGIAQAHDTIAHIDNCLSKLEAVSAAAVEIKRRYLDDMWQGRFSLIDSSVTAALARRDLRIDLPDEPIFAALPVIAPYEELEDQTGYAIDLGRKYYNFFYKREKRYREAMLPAVKALSRFLQPAIRQMLEFAKQDISRLVLYGQELIKRLRSALDTVAPLVVEVSIVNKGRTAVVFAPWALLRLLDDRGNSRIDVELGTVSPVWQPDDAIQAAAYRRKIREMSELSLPRLQTYAVDPGSTMKAIYHSLQHVGTVEAKFPKLRSVLATDLFRCTAYLRRADVDTRRSLWFKARVGVFGGQARAFPKDELPDQ